MKQSRLYLENRIALLQARSKENKNIIQKLMRKLKKLDK